MQYFNGQVQQEIMTTNIFTIVDGFFYDYIIRINYVHAWGHQSAGVEDARYVCKKPNGCFHRNSISC